jgi:hypothetical protein
MVISEAPATMGRRVRSTIGCGRSCKKAIESTTEKNGSMALTVCVKETAIMPREMFVSVLARTWTMARGSTARKISPRMIILRRDAMNQPRPSRPPTKNWMVVAVRGYIHIFKSCLL